MSHIEHHLTLRKLKAFPRSWLTILLTFFGPRIPSEETGTFQAVTQP
jgi:hypothetical protein